MMSARDAERRAAEPGRPALDRTEVGEELQVALSARRELGAELEPEIVESFLDRVERAIDARVDARLAEIEQGKGLATRKPTNPIERLAVSLAFAIPLTAIGGYTAGLGGVALAWAAVFLLNYIARDR